MNKMRLYYWLAVFVCVSLVTATEAEKEQEEDYEEKEEYSKHPEGVDLMEEKVETVSPGLDFNSFSELYDYLKEAEESDDGSHDEDHIDQAQNIRLVLMTDGDTLTLENDSNEENTPTVQGTIDEMTKESPELDLMQNGVLVGEEDQPGDADQPRIMATEADWTFIQDTLKKLDQKESLLAKLVKYETHRYLHRDDTRQSLLFRSMYRRVYLLHARPITDYTGTQSASQSGILLFAK